MLYIFKYFLKFIYFFLKLLPTNKNKIVFISRQTSYVHVDFEMIQKEIEKRNKNIKMVFLCKRMGKGIKEYFLFAIEILRQMYHLATSRTAIIDSYCIPVSVLKHKKSLKVLQIWHSIGKIKKSGYQTLDTESGRNGKTAKILCMHKNYDAIVAGGEAFNKFYEEGFNVNKDVLLNYGLPRIDYIIQTSKQKKNKVLETYPELKGKKIVYYAPTFRTYDVTGPQKLLDAYNPKDFALIITCHPNQKLEINKKGVYHLSLNDFTVADILSISEYVIADFGSISLEAAILKKKTLYYLYDYEEYMRKNGLNLDPKVSMPTCSFETIEPIFDIINNDSYDAKALNAFVKKYLPKKLGQSTKLIVDYVMKHMDGDK